MFWDMHGSFLRVGESLTTLDSEPRFAAKLKVIPRGILRFCGGRVRDERGGKGSTQTSRQAAVRQERIRPHDSPKGSLVPIQHVSKDSAVTLIIHGDGDLLVP